jgi:AcrR family transcriptional regulator
MAFVTTETPRSPRRRPNPGRREELVEAAARVIAREGVANATTRRIAEEAGAPQGLVHYWFSGKEELIEEVLAAYLREFEADVEQATDENPVLDRLRTAFDVVRADDRGRQIAMYELTTWALRTPDKAEIAARQYAAYRETARRLAEPLLATVGEGIPADVLAQFLSSLFDGLVLSWLADPDHTDPDAVLALLGRLLTRAAD